MITQVEDLERNDFFPPFGQLIYLVVAKVNFPQSLHFGNVWNLLDFVMAKVKKFQIRADMLKSRNVIDFIVGETQLIESVHLNFPKESLQRSDGVIVRTKDLNSEHIFEAA